MADKKEEKHPAQRDYEHWHARKDINDLHLDTLEGRLSEVFSKFMSHEKGKGIWINEQGQYDRKAFSSAKKKNDENIKLAAKVLMDLVRDSASPAFQDIYKTKGLTSDADEHIKASFDSKWYGINEKAIREALYSSRENATPDLIKNLSGAPKSKLERELNEAATYGLFEDPEHIPEVYKILGAHKKGLDETKLGTLANENHRPYLFDILKMSRAEGGLDKSHLYKLEQSAAEKGKSIYGVALKPMEYGYDNKKVA